VAALKLLLGQLPLGHVHGCTAKAHRAAARLGPQSGLPVQPSLRPVAVHDAELVVEPRIRVRGREQRCFQP